MSKIKYSREKIIELQRAWGKFRRKLKKERVRAVIPKVRLKKPLSRGQFAKQFRQSKKEAFMKQQEELESIRRIKEIKSGRNSKKLCITLLATSPKTIYN